MIERFHSDDDALGNRLDVVLQHPSFAIHRPLPFDHVDLFDPCKRAVTCRTDDGILHANRAVAQNSLPASAQSVSTLYCTGKVG